MQRLEERLERGLETGMRTGARQKELPENPMVPDKTEQPAQMTGSEETAVPASPLPVEPVQAQEKKETVQPIPEERMDAGNGKKEAAVDGNGWRLMAEHCKGRLPPMYRAFLDLCSGVQEGDQMTVYVPDDMTLNRLDNDRVRNALCEEIGAVSDPPLRLVFRVGTAPQVSQQENLKKLLEFGSQFDNIEIQ